MFGDLTITASFLFTGVCIFIHREPSSSMSDLCAGDIILCRGASQLIQHDVIKPSSIHAGDVLQMFGDEYMYLSSVVFVKEVS